MNPRLMALVNAAREKHGLRQQELAAKQAAPEPAQSAPVPKINALTEALGQQNASHAGGMSFNAEQLTAIELALQGKSFCLIGAAGTGKTTVTQEIIARLQRASHVSPLADDTKHLISGNPGIVICGFTNKAVNNIRKKLPEHLQKHCLTIHKLLEYAPVYYEVINDEGLPSTTMRFEPLRNGANPLPHISTIIFEESSMIGTDLYGQVIAALPMPSRTQIIMLGDLNQIPPVFGPSILGFKLAELTTVELTHVYRQALASPIISLATAIRTNSRRAGTFQTGAWHELESMIVPNKLAAPITIDRGEHGNLTIHPWKRRVEKESALAMMNVFLPKMIESGEYNPDEDMILCPFNKSFGTIELNKIIADFLTKRRGETTWEVIARYQRSYWAVGDRVMVDRHEATITSIKHQHGYDGKLPQPESKKLDRWGNNPDMPPVVNGLDDVLSELDRLGGGDDESRNLSSHTIEVYIPDLDEARLLNTAGEINTMLLGYCLTIHKSQGSEWQKVFLFLHNSHATMLSRELIYTGITRAKHSIYIITEGDSATHKNSLDRAADRPIIPGTTLAEKIDYFRAKKSSIAED
jgi:exodeoxyribonuclease V alpha subunit